MFWILRVFYLFLIQPLLLFLTFTFGWLFVDKIKRGINLRLSRGGQPPWKKVPKNLSPLWFHCSSGEFEYAKAVIREIKSLNKDTPILVTYFSPTYIKQIEKDENVDYVLALPFDLPGPLSSFIQHIHPRALYFSRTDLWPELIFQCRRHHVPTHIFSLTCGKKLRGVQGFIKKLLLNQLDQIFAVSLEDKTNLIQSGVVPAIEVIGDTRFAQAIYRRDHFEPKKHISMGPQSTLPILIAGSTWPEDEKILLPAVLELLVEKKMRLVLAAHEPTPEHLKPISLILQKAGIDFSFFTQVNEWSTSVLIVDCVGVLADLYRFAQIAFIGGSFKKSVHSVMEALVCGLPVIVGPKHHNNREAIEFQNLKLNHDTRAVTVVTDSELLKQAIVKLVKIESSLIHASIKSEAEKHKFAAKQLGSIISKL